MRLYDRMKTGNEKPGADEWFIYSEKKSEIYDVIRHEWERISGIDAYLFPFHEDYVADCWVKYRKSKEDLKQRTREKYGMLPLVAGLSNAD